MIEAYGVKGVKSVYWHKTFKTSVAFQKWLNKMVGDIEVYGVRELEESK